MTRRRLIGPASYVQGPGVLSGADTFAALSGGSALVLGGETALSRAEAALRDGLAESGIEVAAVEAGVDSCTFDTIDALGDRGASRGVDVVVGVGGGKAIDASKGVAERLEAELATAPTVASTDAPCSSVAVVYDGEGGFDGYVHRSRNPEVVAVDTRVIAQAPAGFLRDGMGDALATRFEAEAVDRSGAATHAGGRPTALALAAARESHETLRAAGTDALAAAERDAVTPALERVVEANTLLSGIGFESGGLAGAHAFAKGFSRAGATAPHGRIVAFGTVAQLVLEGRDALGDALALCRELGLDSTLRDLGVDGDADRVAREACRADTTMANEPVAVTPRAAADALRTADELIGG